MTPFPKPKRKVDRDFLDTFHGMHCLACGRRGCDPAHVKTRGSFADDDWDNVLPLCRRHHVEQGQIGWKRFSSKHPPVALALESRGWSFDDLGKLRKRA